MLARIPKRFYEDHLNRDLPAPPVVKATKAHYFIDPAHPDTWELLDDARHYSDCVSWDPYQARELLGLQKSAIATAAALRQFFN